MWHNDFIKQEDSKSCAKLADIKKYAGTLAFQRKLQQSLSVLATFFSEVSNPLISCGGGKDSTAIAILAHQISPNTPIVCANPPNPLPDREDHIKNLKSYLGVEWHDVDYNWDVGAVLAGRKKYPENEKIKTLTQHTIDREVDGLVMGLRNSENIRRAINYKVRGAIYNHSDGAKRCLPIANWSAEEVLCLSLLFNAPINPVYTKMSGIGNLDLLHDGTWWAHSFEDKSEWIRKYYPDFYSLHRQSMDINTGYVGIE